MNELKLENIYGSITSHVSYTELARVSLDEYCRSYTDNIG